MRGREVLHRKTFQSVRPPFTVPRLGPSRSSGGNRVAKCGNGKVLFGGEMRVERAVGQPGFAHHGDDGRSVHSFTAQPPGSRIQYPMA